MIDPSWRRIAGIHSTDDGDVSAVWLALEKDTNFVHVYDCCHFKREVMVVIAEGLNSRGRWIPIAWPKKAQELSDHLLKDYGCNILPEPCDDSPAMAEIVSRDIWERMRKGVFKVDKRLAEWLSEFKSFRREEAKVPQDSFPLMSATRHAVSQSTYARRQMPVKRVGDNYPKVAIV